MRDGFGGGVSQVGLVLLLLVTSKEAFSRCVSRSVVGIVPMRKAPLAVLIMMPVVLGPNGVRGSKKNLVKSRTKMLLRNW